MDDIRGQFERRLLAIARTSNIMKPENMTLSERVDIVIELLNVTRTLAEHCRKVMVDGSGKWLEVADMLEKAAEVCRNEAVIDG